MDTAVRCLWWVAPHVAYSDGDPAFWRAALEINWGENWARERYVVGGASAHGIKLSLEDVLALLPKALGEPDETTVPSKMWIAREARQMKEAGEIPPEITITDFAKGLERRMKEAVRTGDIDKSVGWRSIKNRLPQWDLWPISSIK